MCSVHTVYKQKHNRLMALIPRIFGIVSSIKLLNGRLAVDSNKTTYWLVQMKGRPRVDCGIPNQWGFTGY